MLQKAWGGGGGGGTVRGSDNSHTSGLQHEEDNLTTYLAYQETPTRHALHYRVTQIAINHIPDLYGIATKFVSVKSARSLEYRNILHQQQETNKSQLARCGTHRT